MRDSVLVEGQWRTGNGLRFQNYCPATGDVVWDSASADKQDVEDAVESAQRAFAGWSRVPQNERTSILQAFASELETRSDQIAEAISRDMGKALWESRAEAATMVGKVAVSIKAQNERAGTKDLDAAFGSMHLTHRPHGVMAVYGPFNFPGHLPNGHIVPALLAGNVCVFKLFPRKTIFAKKISKTI